MIPGEHEDHEKAETGSDDQGPLDRFRPAKTLRDNVDSLEQGEGSRDIGDSPLDQLALLQASEKFVHRAGLTVAEAVSRSVWRWNGEWIAADISGEMECASPALSQIPREIVEDLKARARGGSAWPSGAAYGFASHGPEMTEFRTFFSKTGNRGSANSGASQE